MLEAQAYTLWMAGTLAFERQQWQGALAKLLHAQSAPSIPLKLYLPNTQQIFMRTVHHRTCSKQKYVRRIAYGRPGRVALILRSIRE